ncbi:VWA-like domain containing protein [uncultured Caudovirales phage]|uniref:VWA-like domain containing protein n=1 Tax=uncultured Caudovirales phage TaxID=2100421 RepID=A0A6J5KYZ1_9CAUD|nr:VWA-like domain containing protein [uncultured Caudovirales phage]
MTDTTTPNTTPIADDEEITAEQQAKLDELKKKSGGALRTTAEALEAAKKEAVSVETMKQCLQTAIYEITKSHPFMGAILQIMNISYTHMLPTAGVMFNAEVKRWDLLINPHFFCNKLQTPHRRAVMLHELYHITHKHPLRIPFIKLSPHKRQIMNIAMDMAINQYIKDLPNGCANCQPPHQGPCPNPDCCGKGIMLVDFYDTDEKTGKHIPWIDKREAEYYYSKLLQRFDDPDPQDGDGEGDGSGNGQGNAGGGANSGDLPQTTDVHAWDGAAEEGDMLEATEDLVKRAQVKCRFSYDELPGHIKELLEHIKSRKAELNYKQILLQAMKASLPANFRVKSWTRKSRRFGNLAPGNMNGEQPELENFIDTSGSISIEEANEFLDIVDEFLKIGARKCTLNMFHTSNYYREDYKRGQRIKREDIQSGGTCLEDSFKSIAKHRPDLAIILTDGHYSNIDETKLVGKNGQFPNVVFIISKDGTTEHPFKDRKWARTVKIPGGTRN